MVWLPVAKAIRRRGDIKMLKVSLQSLVRPKFFWPTVVVLLITSLALYVLKEKERHLRIAKELELTQTIETKKVVENNLAQAQRGIQARDEQIKQSLDKLEKEIAARKEAEARVLAVLEEKRVLEAKIQELSVNPQSIELEKIVVKTMPEITGKVLSYDKENSFVVVNLGSTDNLKLGDTLSIYRDDKFIGKAQVEKIEEKTSAAAILTPWKTIEYKENDMVKKL